MQKICKSPLFFINFSIAVSDKMGEKINDFLDDVLNTYQVKPLNSLDRKKGKLAKFPKK